MAHKVFAKENIKAWKSNNRSKAWQQHAAETTQNTSNIAYWSSVQASGIEADGIYISFRENMVLPDCES